MSQIVIKNLVKNYAGRSAVKDLSITIEEGELTVVVGAEGSGKSALMRAISGLDSADGGEMYIDGVLINKLEPKDRDIAVIMKSLPLYPNLSIYDNMAMGLKMRKATKAEIDEKVKAAAEILGLTPYLQHKPKTLSVGQKQRAMLARAIAREPKLVILDEPFEGLDDTLKKELCLEVLKLNKRLGINFMYMTKSGVAALTIADKILFMEVGVCRQYATPLEIYDRPESLAIAEYFGTPSVNLLQGKLVTEGGKVVALVDGASLPLRGDLSKEAKETYVDTGRNITVAFRAEDVVLDENGPFSVVVDDVDRSDDFVTSTLYSSASDKAKKFLAALDLEKGETVKVSIPSERLNVYDTNSEILID